jgi:hypothetical protein
LESSSIGAGGVTVKDGGSITVDSGDIVVTEGEVRVDAVDVSMVIRRWSESPIYGALEFLYDDAALNPSIISNQQSNGGAVMLISSGYPEGSTDFATVSLRSGNDIDDSRVTLGATDVVLSATNVTVGSANVGFYGASPQTKPTVTGSRGGNAALASLLTALANLGLITDSTSP